MTTFLRKIAIALGLVYTSAFAIPFASASGNLAEYSVRCAAETIRFDAKFQLNSSGRKLVDAFGPAGSVVDSYSQGYQWVDSGFYHLSINQKMYQLFFNSTSALADLSSITSIDNKGYGLGATLLAYCRVVKKED